MTYYLDTNIISYYIKGSNSVEKRISELIWSGHTIKIPIIAYYEIRRGFLVIDAVKKLHVFEDLATLFGIQEMTANTFIIASEIYADLAKKGQPIEDADIFIGASTLENNAILLTNNAGHLGRINDLKIEVIS
ncbi:MAG: PIN domain-containing protein [Spirochaetaceae bacterium]|nr:PIN domain-containing protein [Spirochaetaceae bacterium]